MHHVELLWDEAAEAVVRGQWQRLADAGLPSLAHHQGASNAPHVTLALAEEWPEDLDSPPGLAALPLEARTGALTCFGRGPFVLVWTLVVTDALLEVQASVTATLGPPAREHTAPGRWVPHVTLAHRMSGDDVARALDVLGGDDPPAGRLERARHWDSVARVERPLGPPGAGG